MTKSDVFPLEDLSVNVVSKHYKLKCLRIVFIQISPNKCDLLFFNRPFKTNHKMSYHNTIDTFMAKLFELQINKIKLKII
jgi:hypothetical protein